MILLKQWEKFGTRKSVHILEVFTFGGFTVSVISYKDNSSYDRHR